MVNALGYVGIDHPLLPLPRHWSVTSPSELRSRVRNHAELWWDVLVTIDILCHTSNTLTPEIC
jgi:hypothetical protein